MNKIISLRIGQFLLLMVSLLTMGAAAGVFGAAVLWRAPQARNPAILLELIGSAVFVGLAIWKSVDNWAAKTASKTDQANRTA